MHCLQALAVCCILATSTIANAQQNAKVVVNNDVNITSLSRSDVREIFTSRKQYWSGESKITVFVLDSDTTAHQAFCRQVLNMFPYQLDRLWNQIIYSGQGERPKTVESEAALLHAVASTPGAIGYLYDEATSVNVHEVVIP